MIPIALSTLLLLADPSASATQDQSQTPPTATPETMPVSIADTRIKEALSHDTDPQEREKALREVMTRCEDQSLVSLAAYDLGTTLLEQDPTDIEKLRDAIDALQVADRTGTAPRVRADARFNVGHAHYLIAHAQDKENNNAQPGSPGQGVDLQGKIDALKEKVELLIPAAGAFRSVIEIDPNDTRAAENVERVRREIKDLRDQIDQLEQMLKQQQEQQKQQQQQQQQAADKLKQLAQKQQEEAQQSAQTPPQDEQQQQEQKRDQQEISNETESAKQDLDKQQSSQSDQMEQVKQKLQDARDAQQRAQQAMEQNDPQKAAQEQQQAADKLKEAAQQMQQMADQTKQQNEQQGKDGQPKQGQEGDQKQAEQQAQGEPKDQQQPDEQQDDVISEIAKQLLDKERRERDARQAYRAVGRPTKVDKDW